MQSFESEELGSDSFSLIENSGITDLENNLTCNESEFSIIQES